MSAYFLFAVHGENDNLFVITTKWRVCIMIMLMIYCQNNRKYLAECVIIHWVAPDLIRWVYAVNHIDWGTFLEKVISWLCLSLHITHFKFFFFGPHFSKTRQGKNLRVIKPHTLTIIYYIYYYNRKSIFPKNPNTTISS